MTGRRTPKRRTPCDPLWTLSPEKREDGSIESWARARHRDVDAGVLVVARRWARRARG